MNARARFSFILGLSGAALALCLLPARAVAQAPPGPLPGAPPQDAPATAPVKPVPQVKPRQAILGAWRLNKDESDSPRDSSQQQRGGRGGYGGRGGGGYPGGGYPGGGGRGGYGNRGGLSEEDRAKMRELFTPARAISFVMSGAEVDMTDDLDRKRAFMTDGRKLQKSKDSSYAEIAAHWEGTRLVTDEKDPRGNKLSRSYELSPGGLQLFETIRLEGGRSGGGQVIRYVYDAVDSPSGTPSRRPS